MPVDKHSDEIELCGRSFRLRRVRGFAASEARAVWADVVGPKGAHLLALGAAEVAKTVQQLITDEQRKAFEALDDLDETRALIMLGIVQVMQAGTMTRESVRQLTGAFVLGWVDVKQAGEWVEIISTDTLDNLLDGADDGEIWWQLMWRSVTHSLGPSIAGLGTSGDTAQAAKT
jgi:hypothetical protein